MAEVLFPEGVPSVTEFSASVGAAPSTFRRMVPEVLESLGRMISELRPGPVSAAHPTPSKEEVARQQALHQLADLRTWAESLVPNDAKNHCYPAEAKQRIADLAERLIEAKTLTHEEIAGALGISDRQLRRIRDQVSCAGGEAPRPKSRRPENTHDLHPRLQDLIRQIAISAPKNKPYGATDIRRILQARYSEQLQELHGKKKISRTTVAKYMSDTSTPSKTPREHPRGSYIYPEPFQQVAVDTTYFKFAGLTFYLITVFEMAGRLNLVTKVFLKETIDSVVMTLQEYLDRFPGIGVVVIDRGTPYLNDEVHRLLQEHRKDRVVCRPATPTEKAACERHFRPLKAVLRRALHRVWFDRAPLSKQELLALIEMGVFVFQDLYPHIPQHYIDGRSPAERIESFDPVRAARMALELFERSLETEPPADLARYLHHRFQLPGDEAETEKALKRFGTAALRRVLEEQGPVFEPPHPSWLEKPLEFLTARAREAAEKEIVRNLRCRFEEERARRQRHGRTKALRALDEERRTMSEHPECFVDSTLERLGLFLQHSWSCDSLKTRFRDLLTQLSNNLGRAFPAEVDRLARRIDQFPILERCKRQLRQLLDSDGGLALSLVSPLPN
jgi:hypothetical protein